MTIKWSKWAEPFDLAAFLDPEQADRDWEPTDVDRAAAWDLLTEIRSRIATQPLHWRAGDEVTALKSVHELFPKTRAILAARQRECEHFAGLTMAVLNGPVRPFTAKWHKKQVDGRLAIEDERQEFRTDLERLQVVLRNFEAVSYTHLDPRS